MHELPYEPPREGVGDSRRLARWLAAWTLAVFGLMGVPALISVGEVALQVGVEGVLAGLARGAGVLGHAISGLCAPLAVAALAAWLISGRVVVLLLTSVPLAAGAGGGFSTLQYIAEFGPDWQVLWWLPIEGGCLVLGLLFLTSTFRRAVNAPRHPSAGTGA